MSVAVERLERRVREIRARSEIRRWEMRQLDHAGGVWFRVTRLLTYARSAWAIADADVAALMAAGHAPHPAGLELQPPRRLFWVADEERATLPSARPVLLRASLELLSQEALALVPFEGFDPS